MKVYVLFAGNINRPMTMGLYKTKRKAQEVKDKLDASNGWADDRRHNQYESRIEHWGVEE